jgi:hypothetical protein
MMRNRFALALVVMALALGCAGLKQMTPLQRCYLASAEGTVALEQVAHDKALIPASQLANVQKAAVTLDEGLTALAPVCKTGSAANQTALITAVENDVKALTALLPPAKVN